MSLYLRCIRRHNSFLAAEVDEFGESESFKFVDFIFIFILNGDGRFDAEGFTFGVVESGDGGDEVAEFGAGEVAKFAFERVVQGSIGGDEFSEGEPQHGQVERV